MFSFLCYKLKTAYEWRSSDWSSDVCSSDLARGVRRVDLHRLARGASAPRRVRDVGEGAHVVEAVGELHQGHADVLGHRDDELLEILRLLGLVGLEFEARELCHPVDEAGDVRPEHLLDEIGRARV